MASFADNLKFFRKKLKLTQQQLAERSGLVTSVITRYETGGAVPRPKSIEKLAKALEVEPSELRGDEPGKELLDLLKRYQHILDDQQIMHGLCCVSSMANSQSTDSRELLTNLTKVAKTNMSVAIATDNTLNILEKHGIVINNEIVIKVLEVSSYQVWKALEREGKNEKGFIGWI